jgi:mRNA interferase MazF
LHQSDFEEGGLRKESNVRPNRLFTADRRIVLYHAGTLTERSMQAVTDAIVCLLRE